MGVGVGVGVGRVIVALVAAPGRFLREFGSGVWNADDGQKPIVGRYVGFVNRMLLLLLLLLLLMMMMMTMMTMMCLPGL